MNEELQRLMDEYRAAFQAATKALDGSVNRRPGHTNRLMLALREAQAALLDFVVANPPTVGAPSEEHY